MSKTRLAAVICIALLALATGTIVFQNYNRERQARLRAERSKNWKPSPEQIAVIERQTELARQAQLEWEREEAAELAAEVERCNTDIPGATLEIPKWAGEDGEPFDVRAYLESRMPPADNGASCYIRGLAEIEPHLAFVFPDAERDDAEEYATRRRNWLRSVYAQISDPETSPSDGDLETALSYCVQTHDFIDAAQQRQTCLFVTALGYDMLLPHAQAIRHYTLLTTLEVEDAINARRGDLVIDSFKRQLKLNRDLRYRGSLISQLVSIASDAVLRACVFDQVVPRTALTIEQCDLLVRVYMQHLAEGLDIAGEACRMDYICGRNAIDSVETGQKTLEDWDLGSARGSTLNFDLERTTLQSIFTTMLNDCDRPYSEVLQSPAFEPAFAKIKKAALAPVDISGLPSSQGRINRPVFVATLCPAYDQMREAIARHEAQSGCVLTILSAYRFKLSHGAWPGADEMREAYREAGIESAPLDPYSGKPIGYALVNGEPITYAVGPDQVDDGGLIEWDFKDGPGDYVFRIRNQR